MKTTPFSAKVVLILTILSVVVLLGACKGESENETPIIFSISGDPATVAIAESSTITCVASDPDGDTLSYDWSASRGTLSGTGKAVTWMAPDAAGTYTISVTVDDGKGGVADQSYTITVVTEKANKPPVISSLSADPKSVQPEKSATITCEATDPDGDQLSYSWWTDLGRIEGTGNVVSWVAPVYLGEYIIEVTVRDNKGGVDVKSRTVTVALNEPPRISRVSAKPSIIILDQSTTITCTAEDPEGDPLSYTWSAIEGSISGEGKVITWTAPGRAGYFTIEVTVDDDRGGTDTESVTVQTIGRKVTIPLRPIYRESGSVRSDGVVVTQWTAGDDTANHGVRNYLSFDISKITKLEEFRGAVLIISTLDKNGTPWTDLGDFLIDEVEYGARPLKAADYEISGDRLESFESAPVTEIDLTTIISRAIRDKVTRFQIRLSFRTETDDDNSADNLKVTSAELAVHYVESTW